MAWGGADPLTSKVAIVESSSRSDSDVDYTLGYVGIEKGLVDYQGNCGNISQGVGPFAVDEGLVPAVEPLTPVRIFNTNTGKRMVAEVPVRDGRAVSEGGFSIPGVPGTGARIIVDFLDASGSKTGRLLPTGNVVDTIDVKGCGPVEVSLVDAAAPAIFARAADVGLTARELPDDCERDRRILAVMDEIRVQGALTMKLAPDADGRFARYSKSGNSRARPRLPDDRRRDGFGFGLRSFGSDVGFRSTAQGICP